MITDKIIVADDNAPLVVMITDVFWRQSDNGLVKNIIVFADWGLDDKFSQ